MGVPASLIRRLIARAARTAIAEGQVVRRAPISSKLLKQALARKALLAPKSERGENQLNRLRSLLEKMGDSQFYEGRPLSSDTQRSKDFFTIRRLFQRLDSTEQGVDEFWRRLMEGEL